MARFRCPCGPQGFGGGTNLLYRNRGDGTFEDVTEKAGIGNPHGSSIAAFVPQDWRPTGSYGMGAAAADFDNDGWPDIYVALRHRAQPALSQQSRRHISRSRGGRRVRL